jgi:hypothetical protein
MIYINMLRKTIFEQLDSIKKLIYLPPKLSRPDITFNQLLILEKNIEKIFKELQNVNYILERYYPNRRSGPR